MSKRINDCYEYKEAPIRQAMAYASFGWLIGKRSQHYSRKYNRDVVTLRRDFLIGANPTIRECEKEYLQLERGKIPAKYRSHAFLGAIGKIFLILLTIAVLFFGLAQAAVGVYDGLKVEKNARALYNAAVENELLPNKETVRVDAVNKSYVEFVKSHATIDTFSELVDFAAGKADEEKLLKSYKNWLFVFGEATFANEDSFIEADPTIAEKDGEYPKDEKSTNVVFDAIRSAFAFANFDWLFDDMPLWVNSSSALGAAALLLFIVLIIIESVVGKAKKKKKRQRCAELMIECSKNASNALFDMKAEHRELRTRKDAHIYDLQTMFTKMMDSRDEDD